MAIRALAAPASPRVLPELTALLLDAVRHGASISFMADLTEHDARAYWQRTLAALAPDSRADRPASANPVVLVAEIDGRIVGTAQLHPAWPPNQPHRADVAKVIVHSAHRRRGIARQLMAAIESHALARGRTLLVLDTVPQSDAHRLYLALGYQTCGIIPGFALLPDGPMGDTVVLYKHLAR